MRITFDPAKRDLTLRHRGLDFARAGEVFAGRTATIADTIGSITAKPVSSLRVDSTGGWW
jgi:uncharacterized DUF497 family protein